MSTLEQYRKQIQAVDQQLYRTLAQRFAITEQVGKFKKAHDLPARDKARETAQDKQAEGFAAEHGLDAELLRAIMVLIRDAVVKRHEEIRKQL